MNSMRVVAPVTGGMSITADNPIELSHHRRPASYDGLERDPVFEIHGNCIGGSLSRRQVSP